MTRSFPLSLDASAICGADDKTSSEARTVLQSFFFFNVVPPLGYVGVFDTSDQSDEVTCVVCRVHNVTSISIGM